MPGFNTLPATGGGGGQSNMTFVASVHMTTYNRSWAQGGTAGYYAMYSTNQENGYAYFVGSGTTTGIALNRLANITHAFTRIDIVAPQNDMISLYKAKVKATTEFANPLAGFSSFPSVISSSGNFVLPNNALPLINVLVCGSGGTAGRGHTSHGGAGAGAGSGVVKLTAYQAVGTTAVVIGATGTTDPGHNGQRSYFGNVYALGGGYGSPSHNGDSANYYRGTDVANYGGNSAYGGSGHVMATPTAQTATTGLGVGGSPAFHGGFKGGLGAGGSDGHNRGGGGGGAGGNGGNGSYDGGAEGGLGHISDISGSNLSYGPGGQGHGAHGSGGVSGWDRSGLSPVGHGAHATGGTNNNGSGTGAGRVVVRYYIP
jgi:hypothetical protein